MIYHVVLEMLSAQIKYPESYCVIYNVILYGYLMANPDSPMLISTVYVPGGLLGNVHVINVSVNVTTSQTVSPTVTL